MKIPVKNGEVLELTFTLHDPDTKKTLTYTDTVNIIVGGCV